MLRSPEMRFHKLRYEYTSSSSRFQIFRLLRRRDVATDARGEKDGYGGENEIRAGKDEDSSTEFQWESQLVWFISGLLGSKGKRKTPSEDLNEFGDDMKLEQKTHNTKFWKLEV
ncbi:unnamed protein product [Vicia faba]|uniref:Uncharacterized protein n=1 Tax=Vicia faba TaxID=3906 RepID=A0AAV1B8D1_VICFA|nr:unnamed protein product [Vicia faba]